MINNYPLIKTFVVLLIRCVRTHQVRSDGIAHLRVHVHIHVEQLRQVEVHLAVQEAEEAVPDVRLHTWLLGLVQVGDRHGDVKQLGLKQAQQP